MLFTALGMTLQFRRDSPEDGAVHSTTTQTHPLGSLSAIPGFYLWNQDFMTSIAERYNQAEKLKDAGQLEEAEKSLLELISEAPSHALAHMTLARIYTSLERHEEAVQHAEKACELEPTESFNYTLLSVTYQRAYAGTGDQRYIRMAEDAMARSRML